MYRSLALLLISAVSSAPKGNSDITYVKLHPLTQPLPPSRTHYRESRIENLPLTIPGNVDLSARKSETDKADVGGEIEESVRDTVEDSNGRRKESEEAIGHIVNNKGHEPKADVLEDVETPGSDINGDGKVTEKDLAKEKERTVSPDTNAKRFNPKIIHPELRSENLSDKHFTQSFEDNKDDAKSNLTKRSPDTSETRSESEQGFSETRPIEPPKTETEKEANFDIAKELGIQDPYIRSEDIESSTTSIYDDDDGDDTTLVTEKNESLEQLLRDTDEYEVRTRAPVPRFLSKLSYFQKNAEEESVVTNFIERTGKRGFKSKCRCEKIWNCPRLQITVPRCPNEYFLCC